MNVEELKQMRDDQKPHQLVDIREAYEVAICNIGGAHIPMAEILDRQSELEKDTPLVILCRSGRRAKAVVDSLHRSGFEHAVVLEGGILDWIDKFDSSLEKY